MFKEIVFGISCLMTSFIYGQYGESIRSDRPCQAISSFTVGKNIFQLQSGIDYLNNERSARYGVESFRTYNFNHVFRYGITEHTEVNLSANWQQDRYKYRLTEKVEQGFNGVAVSMRSNVFEGSGLKPSLGYQVSLGLPVGSDEYRSENIIPRLTLVTGQNFGEKWGLTTNFGFAWSEGSSNPTKFYVLNLGYSITDKWTCFVDNYGFLLDGEFDTPFDGGVAYLANNNLQLDLYGGYDQINAYQHEYFISLGLSWRTSRK